jgi:hypothetical protein
VIFRVRDGRRAAHGRCVADTLVRLRAGAPRAVFLATDLITGDNDRHYPGRGWQKAACSGATTSVGNAAGPLEATPDAVAPKSGPSVVARPATLPPNAAQLPCSGACAAAPGDVSATAPTARMVEIVLVRIE